MFGKTLPLVAVIALFGCNSDNPENPGDDTQDTDEEEMVYESSFRVVHASPDAPEVDVWVQGLEEPIIEGLAFGEASGEITVESGTYTVELRPAGASGTSAPAFSSELMLGDESSYTVVAAGSLLSSDSEESFRLLALEESWQAETEGTFLARIVHASPDAPTVAIDVGDDASAEIASLARFADTGASGVALPAETALQVALWADSSRVTAFTVPALPEGSQVLVVATGFLSDLPREDTGFSLLAVGPSGSLGFIGQNPVLYALHASPDAPAVDLFVGDAEIAANLDFGQLSAPIQVPPGAYTVEFHGHEMSTVKPSAPAAATVVTPELEPGQRYLGIAKGYLTASPEFALLPLSEGFSANGDEAALRAVHASPDAPAVDIGTVASGQVSAIWTEVPYGAASPSEGLALPAGSYDLGIAAAGTTSPLFTFSGVSLGAGDRIIAVAAGEALEGTFHLLAVDVASWPWMVAPLDPDGAGI